MSKITEVIVGANALKNYKDVGLIMGPHTLLFVPLPEETFLKVFDTDSALTTAIEERRVQFELGVRAEGLNSFLEQHNMNPIVLPDNVFMFSVTHIEELIKAANPSLTVFGPNRRPTWRDK